MQRQDATSWTAVNVNDAWDTLCAHRLWQPGLDWYVRTLANLSLSLARFTALNHARGVRIFACVTTVLCAITTVSYRSRTMTRFAGYKYYTGRSVGVTTIANFLAKLWTKNFLDFTCTTYLKHYLYLKHKTWLYLSSELWPRTSDSW